MKSSSIVCITATVRTLFAALVLLALSSTMTFAQSVSATNLGGGRVRITATTNEGVPYLWKICYKMGRYNPVPASACLNSDNIDIVSSANPLISTVSSLKTGHWYTFAVRVQYSRRIGLQPLFWKYVGKAQIKVN
jgi:hypothetical protein